MPTNLDRVQCLLNPDPYAKVRTLAKHNRRTLSAMAAELIEVALRLPKYQDQLEEAEIQVPSREDPRSAMRQPQLKKDARSSPNYQAIVDQVGEGTLNELEDMGLTTIPAEKLDKIKKLLELLG